jgi:hypothetical protein
VTSGLYDARRRGFLWCYTIDMNTFYLAFVGAGDNFDDLVPWKTHKRDLLTISYCVHKTKPGILGNGKRVWGGGSIHQHCSP